MKLEGSCTVAYFQAENTYTSGRNEHIRGMPKNVPHPARRRPLGP